MFAGKKKKGKLIGPDDFEVLSVIGRGAFGKVWLVKEKKSAGGKEELLAMKVMSKSEIIEHEYIEHTNKEREIMSDLVGSPFVTELKYSFQTETSVYLVMNFVGGGSLFQYVSALEDPLSEPDAIFYVAQILVALESLHEKGIVYRDLKLENILLQEDGYIQLSDFGLSTVLRGDSKCSSLSGTRTYLAPEVLDGAHDHRVDFWALGVLTYLLLILEPPFYHENTVTLFEMIKNQEVDLEPFTYLSTEAVSFIEGTLQKDPEKRLGSQNGVAELKQHPLFRKVDWKKIVNHKVKAPYTPPINRGDPVQLSRVSDVENRSSSSKVEAGVDTFGGFSFVASHSQSENDPAGESNTEMASSKGKDRLMVEFGIEFQRADGLQEKHNDSQYYVKWSVDSKKVSGGQTSVASCTDRAVEWSAVQGDNRARFTTSMTRDSLTGAIMERRLTLSLREKKTDKSIGSVKVNLADYAQHQLYQQQIFALSQHVTLTCNCTASWQSVNGATLEAMKEKEKEKDGEEIIQVAGKRYRLVHPEGDDPKKLKRSNSSKILKRMSSFKSSKKTTTTDADGDAESSKSRKKRHSRTHSTAEPSSDGGSESDPTEVSDWDEDTEMSESDVPLRKPRKTLSRSQSARNATHEGSHTSEHVANLAQYKKRKGLNTIKALFEFQLIKLTNLPAKCAGRPVQISWKRGSKSYNAGRTGRMMCDSPSLVELSDTTFVINCSLYQHQQPPFAFEEQNMLVSLRFEGSNKKMNPLVKGTFDLAECSADESEGTYTIELRNSKGVTVKLEFHCKTSWVSINDEPVGTNATEGGASSRRSSRGKKRLSQMLSFKTRKKLSSASLAMSSSSVSEAEDSESDELEEHMRSLRADNEDLREKVENLQSQLQVAQSTSTVEQDEHKEKLAQELQAAYEQEKARRREIEGQLKSLEKKHSKLKTKCTSHADLIRQLEGDRDTLQSRLQEQEKQLHHSTQSSEQTRELQKVTEQSRSTLQVQVEQLTQRVQEAEKQTKDAHITHEKAAHKNDKALKKEKARAAELETQLAQATAQLASTKEQLQVKRANASEELNQTSALLEQRTTECESLRSELQEVKKQADALATEKKKITKKASTRKQELVALTAAMEATKSSRSSQVTELEAQVKQLTAQLTEAKQATKDLQSSHEQVATQLKDSHEKLTRSETQKQKAAEEQRALVDSHEQEMAQLRQQNEGRVQKLQEQLTDMEARWNEERVNKAASTERELLESHQAEIKTLKAEHSTREQELEDRVETLTKELKTTQQSLVATTQQLEEAQQQSSESDDGLAEQVEQLKEQLAETSHRLEDQQAAMEELQESHEQVLQEKEELQERLDSRSSDDDSSRSSDDSEDSESSKRPKKKRGGANAVFEVSSLKKDLNVAQEENEFLSFLLHDVSCTPLTFTNTKSGTVPVVAQRIWKRMAGIDVDDVPAFLKQVIDVIRMSCKRAGDHLFARSYWLCAAYALLNHMQSKPRYQFRQYTFDKLFFAELEEEEEEEEKESESQEEEESLAVTQKKLEQLVMNCIDEVLSSAGSRLGPPCRAAFLISTGKDGVRQSNLTAAVLRSLREAIKKISEAHLPQRINDRLMEGIFEFINALIFNELMNTASLCTSAIGLSIKMVVSHLTEWIVSPETFLSEITSDNTPMELRLRLMPLTNAANALLILANGAGDEFSTPQELYETFSGLSPAQLYRLISQFRPSEEEEGIPQRVRDMVARGVKRDQESDLLFDYPFSTVTDQSVDDMDPGSDDDDFL